MTTIIHFRIVILILVTILCYNRCEKIDKILMRQPSHQKHNLQNGRWPSFPNTDSSYVYFLGLFLKHRTTTAVTRHFQTSAELAMFRAAILLSQQLNITINGKQIAYRLEETDGRDVIEALHRTCVAINEDQVLGIVGPEYSTEAKTVARLCNRVGIPIIGYSTTEPDLSDRNAYKNFYRLPPSDIKKAQALLKLFQKYKWNSTNVIYQGDSYGQGGLEALTTVFNDKIKISRTIRFDLFTNQIENFQRQLEDSPSRIVIVMANTNVTTEIIRLALKAGGILAPSFLWILTAANSSMDIFDHHNINQLTGMLILRLVSPQIFNIPTNTHLLNSALDIWKEYDPDSFHEDDPYVDNFALYAFDAVWMLIQAYQQLCQKNPISCLSFENTSDCFNSNLTSSDELHKILQTMRSDGITGPVQFGSNSTDRVDDTGTHYMIDNVQPSSDGLHLVEILVYNETALNITRNSTTEWTETRNSIRWPREWDKEPADYALLKGKTLNITVYISPPFFMERSSRDIHGQYLYEGYIHDLLMLLKERMEFNFVYTVASNETSYDDLVECVKNRTCEIAWTDLAMTPTRRAKIDFSASFHSNTIRLAVLKSNKKTIRPFAFFQSFEPLLWILIIFVIYIPSALSIALYENCYLSKIPTENLDMSTCVFDEAPKKAFCKSLYLTIGALLQRGSELQVKTIWGRFQTVIVWLMSIIIVSLFTSKLIVYFTAQTMQPWLNGIEDLDMCRKVHCNRIGVLEHSQHEEYFIKEVMHDYPINYHHLKHPRESFTKLVNKYVDVALTDTSTAEYWIQKEFCQVELAGVPFSKTDFGVAVPKEWPYKQDLDAHILELRTNGEFDKRLAPYLQQKNCDISNDNQAKYQNDGLTVSETAGLFIVFGALSALILVLFFLKQIRQYLFKSKVHKLIKP